MLRWSPRAVGGYHDVVKHSVLLRLLAGLQQTSVPWTYVDYFGNKGARLPLSSQEPDGSSVRHARQGVGLIYQHIMAAHTQHVKSRDRREVSVCVCVCVCVCGFAFPRVCSKLAL
jgi:23S rRNA A2030 N6-methylase RlmJ